MSQVLRRRPFEIALPSYGVFVLESWHAPGFRMASQRHEFLELFYVLDGGGAIHLESQSYPCERGDVVAVPPGLEHRLEDDPSQPLALYGICVAEHIFRAEPSLMDGLDAGPQPVGAALAAQVRADLRRLLYEQTLDRPGSRAWIVGRTLQLLAALVRGTLATRTTRPDTDGSEYRRVVARYIADLPHHFFEATDLDRAAAELGMSRRRFTQLFRETTGTSWSTYLTRLRIDYACQLLRDTSRSVTAVAFECGFEDLSNFYRTFKRRTGSPPHAWRQQQADA